MDGNNNIIGYDEKPVKEFSASTGIYIFQPRVLDFIESDTYLDFPTLVLKLIEAGERVMGYPTEAFWLDMGNKDDYETAVTELKKNRSAFHIDG